MADWQCSRSTIIHEILMRRTQNTSPPAQLLQRSGKPWLPGSVVSSTRSWREAFADEWHRGMGFFMDRMPFVSSNQQEAQSTDPNQRLSISSFLHPPMDC